MNTGTVSLRGQVVIPSKIRHRHNIRKGTRVCFVEKNGEIVLQPITDSYIDSVRGLLKTKGTALKALLAEKERERGL
jgi:AbrB family looped-hinge helix DNA binding protein